MSDEKLVIPSDYKDLIYKLTYFLIGKIAFLVPRSIKPNYITVGAFTSAMLGNILLILIKSPVAYLYWAIFNFIWYVLDALDGIHARLTQQTSEFGAFLDHYFDNIFFLMMFIAFIIKFQLTNPFYISIILLRFTAATTVFIVQVHTKKLYLSRLSGGTEFILLSLVMILSYLFPHVDLTHIVSNPTLLSIVKLLDLNQSVFIKLILPIYLIGIPITFAVQYRFARNQLC